MSHTFSIKINSEIELVLNKVKSEISNNGGKLIGNNSSGSISINLTIGSVTGDYRVSDNSITMTINSKPFYLSYSKIESEIKKYINE